MSSELSRVNILNNGSVMPVVALLSETICRSAAMSFPPQLTGRTKNSIRYESAFFGEGAVIHIDPQAYKLWEYLKSGKIINVGGKGYALELELAGSPFGNHINFASNAIIMGINAFKQIIESTGKYEVIVEY